MKSKKQLYCLHLEDQIITSINEILKDDEEFNNIRANYLKIGISNNCVENVDVNFQNYIDGEKNEYEIKEQEGILDRFLDEKLYEDIICMAFEKINLNIII